MNTEKQKKPMLEVKDLVVAYRQNGKDLEAVRNVSMRVWPGEVCGLVGESGSGKTTLALAIMGYSKEEAQILEGSIRFNGEEMVGYSQRQMRELWGNKIALVPQDPLPALNPSMTIGDQSIEALRHHQGLNRSQAKEQLIELFQRVKLNEPQRVMDSYPHQISGGMLQRVHIAMAISTHPHLLVMDEPTSSLDVTTEAAILKLLKELIHEQGMTVLYITHNLGVVAQVSDRIAVMYAGELVEVAPSRELFRQALHPYTQGLLDSVPILGQNKSEIQLKPVEGQVPSLKEIPPGCVFRDRCPLAIEICKEYPPLYASGDQRDSRCHRWEEIAQGEVSASADSSSGRSQPEVERSQEVLLDMQHVAVYFNTRRTLWDRITGKEAKPVRAVNGVDMEILRGQTHGLVGESGSGKTTLARAMIGLAERTGGKITMGENVLPAGLKGRKSDMLARLQIVFQNPDEALNPYMSLGEILSRPLRRIRGLSAREADERVLQILENVHLSADYQHRLPGQLSGGQKQRVAVARAFAPEPDLLIADEPVTSLDVSIQASILNLLNELQARQGNSMLFISHDLAVVGYLADQIAVMYLGQLMETSPAGVVFTPPFHPYTEVLLGSVPIISAEKKEFKSELEGQIPEPGEEITGCPFHTRCPRFLGDICVEQRPPWREDEGSGKRIFCHIPLEDLEKDQTSPLEAIESQEEGDS